METSIFLWFSHGLPMDHPTSSQCIPMVSGTPATLSRVTQVGLLSLYTPEMMAPISEHESSTMGIYMHLYIYIHIIHRINIYIYNYIYYIQWWESEIWTHIQLKGSRSIKPTKIGCHQSVNERLSLEHLYNTLGMGLQFSIFRFYIFPYHIIFPLQATLDRPFWYFLILVSSYTLEN